jgi:hypothetical protein
MNCPSIARALHRAFPLSQDKTAKSPGNLLTLLLLSPLFALAQDVGVGSPAEPSGSAQPSVIQRVEIVARQGSTELRRAASFAK